MGRGLLPAHLVRDAKGVSEDDWSRTHAKVLLPSMRGGYVKAFVKITKGDHFNGQGIVDDKVASPVGLGTPIEFAGGNNSGVRPKFVKRLHRKNGKDALLKGVTDQLVRSMQMK